MTKKKVQKNDELEKEHEDGKVDSFKMYPSKENGKEEIKDGKKALDDFHMYNSTDEDDENDE